MLEVVESFKKIVKAFFFLVDQEKRVFILKESLFKYIWFMIIFWKRIITIWKKKKRKKYLKWNALKIGWREKIKWKEIVLKKQFQ